MVTSMGVARRKTTTQNVNGLVEKDRDILTHHIENTCSQKMLFYFHIL